MGSFILGAGATGLAAGSILGWKIFEAAKNPGGICSSYYVQPGTTTRQSTRAADEEDYRFEIGGGHWMFGDNLEVFRLVEQHCSLKRYARRASVFFPKTQLVVPYPLQNHLSYLPDEIADKALDQLLNRPQESVSSMYDWFYGNFGSVLCDLFFSPFHRSYTANMWNDISPQDSHKSPIDRVAVLQGRHGTPNPVGYNVEFAYPVGGLGTLLGSMAAACDVHYEKMVVAIDPLQRSISFSDGTSIGYEKILSTIPLNRMIELAGVGSRQRSDPFTSVLVANIGARKGLKCPPDHWLYVPESKTGFFRVGFYSNVDNSFLPRSRRQDGTHVSIYVEKAYRDGEKPGQETIDRFCDSAIAELQEWGFIEEVEAIDPTWIDVAYTWSYPESTWREAAIAALREINILQAGRYGRWHFQGIVDSIGEGLIVGKIIRDDQLNKRQ